MKEQRVCNDMREFIEISKEVSEYREIRGADWNLEIGALVEATAELVSQAPMLLFDNIKGYPPGFRVVSLVLASYRRVALAFALSPDASKLELCRLVTQKMKSLTPIPPVEVKSGPVMENVMTGEDVNLFKFPALKYHEDDGGRYIGTGDTMINADPESNYVNMGTYRMQLHEQNLLGLWIAPGQQGKLIAQKYWEKGKPCPVVATFGQDPLTFLVSSARIPWGRSELDYLGGLRGKPVEVINGPVTGLPIPAHAEIAIEGEIPPPSVEAREEGPYGEWPGYYAGGTLGTGELGPVLRVKAIYHRNDPILGDEGTLWPGANKMDLSLRAGLLWDQLESAGIQDITGVYNFTYFFYVVAIKQRYPGHAKQAGLAAVGASSLAANGRYVVVVDDDIDPTNFQEVLWAMMTRVDPSADIDIIDNCWGSPLDPRMPPHKRAAHDYTNSRAIFYAVRPFAWREQFPKVSRASREWREKVIKNFQDVIPFPKR